MIVKLQKLPKEFQAPRKEKNLLTYKDFEILLQTENDEIVSSVRVGVQVDKNTQGLITDFYGNPQLLEVAETTLKNRDVKSVDAYYLDGPGKLEHFYKRGYEPKRRTVEIEWDLGKFTISNLQLPMKVKIKKSNDQKELEELFKNSFQPYWIAPQNFKDKSYFVAYKDKQSIGMVDENLETGVVIRKSFGGEGIGSALLNRALNNLKKKGKKRAVTLATSGLDDYDPQIYLYTMNGGKLVREYINLHKNL